MKYRLTSDRLNEAIAEARMSPQELSDKSGINKSSVSHYRNGTHKPGNISAGKMGEILNVNPLWLMGFDVPKHTIDYPNIHSIQTKTYPVLGKVACGEPIEMVEEKEVYIQANNNLRADFVLIAKGDSMTGARIYDGDCVFIHRQEYIENGEIAAVAVGSEATLKRCFYYPKKDMLILKAENPRYEDIVLIGEELEECRILGKAVAFQSNIM